MAKIVKASAGIDGKVLSTRDKIEALTGSDYMKTMGKACPAAWLLNYVNPIPAPTPADPALAIAERFGKHIGAAIE